MNYNLRLSLTINVRLVLVRDEKADFLLDGISIFILEFSLLTYCRDNIKFKQFDYDSLKSLFINQRSNSHEMYSLFGIKQCLKI